MSRYWVSIIFPFLISSCTVGPDFVRPQVPAVKHYTSGREPTATLAADGHVQRFETGASVPENWWRLFHSSKLDPLITRALERNASLQGALANLRQSQDNLQAGYGIFFPQMNGNLGANRQKFSSAQFGGNIPISIFNFFTLSTTISYVLDVFGGQRRTVEGLAAQMEYEHHTVLATYLTLTGNIVNAVIAWTAYRAEDRATQEIIRLQREQVKIADAQVTGGTTPYSTLLSLKSQLATVEATLPPLRQKQSQTEHLLAVLSGVTPAEWKMPDFQLSDFILPTRLPKTLPSDWVRQRPDILEAEAELHVKSAAIGVATAALFPSVNLSVSYGFNRNTLTDLVGEHSSFWNLGGNLTAPLFQGGTLLSKQRAAVEAYLAALAGYRQVVLSAFSQVADTLRALEHDAELVHAQSQALKTSEEEMNLVESNYEAGVDSYLQLLIANEQYYQAKIEYLQGIAQRLQDTVALFVALGGGWWNAKKSIVQNLLKASKGLSSVTVFASKTESK